MLAIVIPYYKLTFFEETLQSLANQTDKRFKVYIGDDASPENPITLLEKYKGQFDFVYQRFEINLGRISLTKQWDRCIALSGEEEWIMILGDDDVLEESIVASWYKKHGMFCGKSNLIRFASKIINEDGQMISQIYKHPEWEIAINSFYRKLKGNNRSSLSEYFFSRVMYLKYGFYDFPLGWYSDDQAWLNFSDNKSIFSINESIVYIRFSNYSISGSNEHNYQKELASTLFFKKLISELLFLFKENQQLDLLRFYESAIKKYRKLRIDDFIFILQYYLRRKKFFSSYRFLKRFLSNSLGI